MDLNNPEKWHTVYVEFFRIGIRGKVGDTTYYEPIPEIRVNCSSPILLVNLDSSASKKHWWLGAWTNLYASINGSYSLIGGSQSCRINDSTLLQFGQPTQAIPYNLSLKFPYWIEEISISIQEYLDPSGIYVGGELAGLTKLIQGYDYLLINPNYGSIPGGSSPELQISRFSLSLPFSQYEVGRFRRVSDGEILADPLIDARPFQLEIIFTSNRRIESGEINVNIRPKI